MSLLAVGCGGNESIRDGSIDTMPDLRQPVATVLASPNRNLDLLFLIDDSPSMSDKQANLAANFPSFLNVLSTVPGGLPDVHIGVATSDMGTKGSEDPMPGPAIGEVGNGGCAGSGKGGNLTTNGATVTGTFISDIKQSDGGRTRNYTGDLATVFSQMALVGDHGCGFEQPLEAMKAALNNNPANAGFLRPDALLAVIFVTDEDDCSLRTPALLGSDSALGPLGSFRCTRFGVLCASGGNTEAMMNTVGVKTGCRGVGGQYMTSINLYRDFLLALKGDAHKIVLAALMGPPTPVEVVARVIQPGSTITTPALKPACVYQGAQGQQQGDSAVRLKSLLDLFPDANTWSTICKTDLSAALTLTAEVVGRAIGSPCITADLADVDPGTPGDQYDCVVEDHVKSNVTVVPACGSATCWRLETDVVNCPLAGHAKLVIERAGVPDPATVTTMRCLLR
jgi:hypothetical protein